MNSLMFHEIITLMNVAKTLSTKNGEEKKAFVLHLLAEKYGLGSEVVVLAPFLIDGLFDLANSKQTMTRLKSLVKVSSRFCCSRWSGLTIVPVSGDVYTAKALLAAAHFDSQGGVEDDAKPVVDVVE
jgi:hypothetical protein